MAQRGTPSDRSRIALGGILIGGILLGGVVIGGIVIGGVVIGGIVIGEMALVVTALRCQHVMRSGHTIVYAR